MNKARRQAGSVAVMVAVAALTSVANAQSTNDNKQVPSAQPLPASPPVRWTPGPGRSKMLPRSGAGLPGTSGKDIWKRVPAISVGPQPARPPAPVDPNPRPPIVVGPGPIYINNGHGHRPHMVQDTGGVSVSGSYADDKFKLSASISSAIASASYRNWIGADNRLHRSPSMQVGYHNGDWGFNWGSSWGWGGVYGCGGGVYPWGFDRYWGYDPSWGNVRIGSTYNYYGPDPALDVNYQPSQASQPTAPPEPPPAPDEIARLAMSLGRYPDAVDALRLHLKDNPSDPAAMRRLGIAQLLARKWDDGFAQIARAYQADPVLSDVPLTSEELGVREDVLRELTGRVVSRARQGRSRDAWMTAAILMQSRDKNEQAITMLEAAKNAGMDATLYARMRQSLSR